MFERRAIGFAVLLLAVVALGTSADTVGRARPRIFADPTGIFGFKVLPPKQGDSRTKVLGVLFSLDEDGQEKVVWREQLVNLPSRVFIGDRGKFVVTIDSYGRQGYEHALVLYDEKGKLVADYHLDDLLTQREIETKVSHSAASRWWASDAELSFDIDDRYFVVTLKWGKVIKLDLKTGKIR